MRIISYKTYKQFAKKYKIKLTKVIDGKRIKKSFYDFQQEIYKFEDENNIKNGLYFI